MQLAYLFERFPTFTQTFCVHEVAALEKQGLNPHIFSIRNPFQHLANEELKPTSGANHIAPDFVSESLIQRVHYLPPRENLYAEYRWLGQGNQLPEGLFPAQRRQMKLPDRSRLLEAAYVGWRLQQHQVGHVHSHFAGIGARTAYWIREYFGISYSFTAHANDVFRTHSEHLSVDLEEIVDAARFVVCVSDFGAEQMRARFPACADKIHRVYNGIHLEGFPLTQPSHNPARIVSIGRLIEKKGFIDLIHACKILKDRGIELECHIVGDGPLKAELEAAIADTGLGKEVILCGSKSQQEIAKLFSTARVFALPCVKEADGGMDNLPTVIAEAMSAGLPIVSTTLAGIPEMVVDNQTGYLVAPHAVKHLAKALEKLLTLPDLAQELGRMGRKHMEQNFSSDVTAAALKELFLTYALVRCPVEK